jgi:hypothetical protein
VIVSCNDTERCPSPLHIVDERDTFMGLYPTHDETVIDGKILALSTSVLNANIHDDLRISIHLRLTAPERRALAAELLKGLDN